MARPWESTQAAEVWRQGAARRAQTLAAATERLLAAARLGPGMRVLDIAAGTGDQTLLAARAVGPRGSILATDISAPMLAVADQTARAEGLTNVETLTADASALELPDQAFDAAICRFGLMFVPDLRQALSRIRAALKPGASFAALVWANIDRNPWMGVQIELQTAIGQPPSPQASVLQALSLGSPGTLETALRDVGFRDVHTETVATPRTFASLDEAVSGMQTSSPTQNELMRQLSNAQRERYAHGLRDRLATFATADGTVDIPGAAILASGIR